MSDMRDISGLIREQQATIADMQSELAEIHDQQRHIMDESCGDERHCTCVPILRREVERLKSTASGAVVDVLAERLRQDQKWGEQNHGHYKWLAILTEELGEASEAMLDQNEPAIYDELVQVAAVALAWTECIRRARAAGGE